MKSRLYDNRSFFLPSFSSEGKIRKYSTNFFCRLKIPNGTDSTLPHFPAILSSPPEHMRKKRRKEDEDVVLDLTSRQWLMDMHQFGPEHSRQPVLRR